MTQHNDNGRSGWNDNEVLLTTTNVDVQHFGKLFTLPVDDQVYAQPLIVGRVGAPRFDRTMSDRYRSAFSNSARTFGSSP
ncbi:hypothetical protein BH09GEM1_BH09GEM1_34530 [soil metagenome]